MFYLICYDISSDKHRTKLANRLIRHGLIRFQYSVFVGHLPEQRLKMIEQWIKTNITLDHDDRLAIIPILKRELEQMKLLGNDNIDREMLLNNRHTYIL